MSSSFLKDSQNSSIRVNRRNLINSADLYNVVDINIGKNIKKYREGACLSLEVVSTHLNISIETMISYEAGSMRVRSDHMIKLLGVLRVSAADIFLQDV